MYFEILSEIEIIERMARTHAIDCLPRLKKLYGDGKWRKIKGIASVELANGIICKAELHWYEASGIGRKEMKIKRILS